MFSFDTTSSNALRHPLYLQWSFGSAVGNTGLWMTRLTLGYVIWELTQSPTLTGLTAFLILALPGILSPIMGVFAESRDPRKIVLFCQIANLGVYLSLSALAFMEVASVVPYLIAAGVTGVLISVWQPARLVMPTLLVTEAAIPSAVGFNSTVFNSSRVLGPALAAGIIAVGGIGLSFLAGVLFYSVFFVTVFFLRTTFTPRPKSSESFVTRFGGGIQEALRHPAIRMTLIASTFSGFFSRSVVELMPAINGTIIEGGTAQTLGYLTSAVGGGAIIMGAILATRRHTAVQQLPSLFLGGIIAGLATLIMAFSASLILLLVLSFISGAASTMTVVGGQSSLLQTVNQDYRARIMSLWGALAFGGLGLGSVVVGGLSGSLGIPPALILFGSLGALGCLGLWLAYSRQARD